MRSAAEFSKDYLASMDARRGDLRHYLPTGFASLDRHFPAMLHAGHLVILAGRAGTGKTALAQQIAEQVAFQGRTVLFFTLEMSVHQLTERSVVRRSGMPIAELRRSEAMHPDRFSRVMDSVEQFERLPFLADDASFDIDVMVRLAHSTATSLERRGLPPLGAVFVDYLQLVSDKSYSRSHDVSQVSGRLKRLARELSVPVVAVSQLKPWKDARPNKRPTLADLRESGSVEPDADLILLTCRDDNDHSYGAGTGLVELLAVKNRHGGNSEVKLVFIPDRLMFGDLARD